MSFKAPPSSRANFTLGARVFAVVGVIFTVAYVFTPEGPLRWIELMVSTVCLLRALYYFYKAARSPAAAPAPEEQP